MNRRWIQRAGLGLLFFMQIIQVMAQKYDYNWVFRSRWPDTVNVVTFTSRGAQSAPRVTSERKHITTTNLSLSNAEGDLVLSSNGCELWDSDFEVVEDSRPLNPGEAFDNLCSNNGSYGGGYQSMMAIPDPKDQEHFLIFHEQHAYTYDSTGRRYIDVGAILLTKVDISDSNMPTLIFKNMDVIRDTMTYGGGLTAVKHANGKAWWILVPLREKACFYRFLIDTAGIHGPDTQCIGRKFIEGGEGGGQQSFSPNGKKYVRWSTRDGINIFDFDRETGLLSNYVDIPFTADSILAGGMSISPNNRFLYITTLLDMYQYDLEAEDIESSQVHIASFDGYRSPGSCTFAFGQLAPDCKIYWSSAGACTELHVIHRPNEKGRACDFRQHDFKRVPNSNFTMPYFPNYRLGTGEVCDSSLMVNVRQVVIRPPEIKVYPNPADHEVTVMMGEKLESGTVTVISNLGQPIIRKQIHSMKEVRLPLPDLPQGIYHILISRKGKILIKEKLIVTKD